MNLLFSGRGIVAVAMILLLILTLRAFEIASGSRSDERSKL